MPLSQSGGGSGGGAMALLGSSVLSGAQASFDTSTILGGNIPGNFNHLRAYVVGRFSDAAASNQAQLQFNGDTGANYDWVETGSTAAGVSLGTGAVAQTSILLNRLPANTATAGRFGMMVLDIPLYAGTTADKTMISVGTAARSTTTADVFQETIGGNWRNTAAITRFVITDSAGGNFVTGSAFYLYTVM